MIRSRLSVDLVFRVPNVHQRAHVEFGQFFAALEPSLNLTALLFIDRTASGQADETVIFAANLAQTVDLDGFVQEGFQKRIDRLGFETITVGQTDLETQFLEFIDTKFFAQTTRAIGSH